MPEVIVFDVNETLLDLAALDPLFRRHFGDTAAKQQWFAQLLQSSLVATITGRYVDFGTIAAHALAMVAARRSVTLDATGRQEIVDGMTRLPPHADVVDNLARLQAAGRRLAALTNSALPVAQAQLAHAGLANFFEQILSVDAVRRFKPHPAVYTMAATKLGVAPAGMRLVAAHDWDVTGAINAGCKGAFVARPGKTLGPLSTRPDVVGKDLHEVTDQLLAQTTP